MILRHENINHLLEQYPIAHFDSANMEHILMLSQQSMNAIATAGGVLPDLPPFEKHPYIQEINLAPHITAVMVGTFPPISYLCDTFNVNTINFGIQQFSEPGIPYFHGNLGSLWHYTPIDFHSIQLHPRAQQPQLIEAALSNAGVLYTDIISFCQRVLEVKNGIPRYTASDKQLYSIIFNSSLLDSLMGEHNVDRLYFTNSSFFGTNNKLFNAQGTCSLNERDAFGLFIKGVNDEGIKIEFSLPGESDNWICINEQQLLPAQRVAINEKLIRKVVLNLRLTRGNVIRTFQVCSAVSPAAVNRGMVRRNQCVINYSKIEGVDIDVAPGGLLSKVLEAFFENNLENLVQYNAR